MMKVTYDINRAESLNFSPNSLSSLGHAAAQLVEALRYKPQGRGFDTRWCHWNISLA